MRGSPVTVPHPPARVVREQRAARAGFVYVETTGGARPKGLRGPRARATCPCPTAAPSPPAGP